MSPTNILIMMTDLYADTDLPTPKGEDGPSYSKAEGKEDEKFTDEEMAQAEKMNLPDIKKVTQSKVITYSPFNVALKYQNIFFEIVYGLQSRLESNTSVILAEDYHDICIILDGRMMPGIGRQVSRLKQQLKEMTLINFELDWRFSPNCTIPEEIKQKYTKTYGLLIQSYHHIGNSKFIVKLDDWAVVYLIYIGKCIGYTSYNVDVLRHLDSKHFKKLYLLLMDWRTTCTNKRIPLDEFMKLLMLDEDYDKDILVRRILKPCQKLLTDLKSEVNFDFELECTDKHSMSHKRDMINIAIISKENLRIVENNFSALVMELERICSLEKKELCATVANHIISHGDYKHFQNKFSYYYKLYSVNKIDLARFKNTVLKIIRTEYGFDLRSDEHIVRSRKFDNKKK